MLLTQCHYYQAIPTTTTVLQPGKGDVVLKHTHIFDIYNIIVREGKAMQRIRIIHPRTSRIGTFQPRHSRLTTILVLTTIVDYHHQERFRVFAV